MWQNRKTFVVKTGQGISESLHLLTKGRPEKADQINAEIQGICNGCNWAGGGGVDPTADLTFPSGQTEVCKQTDDEKGKCLRIEKAMPGVLHNLKLCVKTDCPACLRSGKVAQPTIGETYTLVCVAGQMATIMSGKYIGEGPKSMLCFEVITDDGPSGEIIWLAQALFAFSTLDKQNLMALMFPQAGRKGVLVPTGPIPGPGFPGKRP